MNREGTLYELTHFVAVVAIAYLTLFVARIAGVTALWMELVVTLLVGVGYVLAVLYLDLAPPSWRGNRSRRTIK
ncbi:hypothetical protein [Halalkalicoccus subterraneus]|uniref:hypothetical protein n=1 Tax=Halalkalicoccus subterraneus TaxID=2675002 RepID=UPI000EFB2331|nr:hypothetical protein [Halalkalicoccus subterraneus]